MHGSGWHWQCSGLWLCISSDCLPCLCAEPQASTLVLAPRGFAPGCTSAPYFPILFHCSFPPLHPPQNCLAGLQSQALRSWETSSCVCSTMQQLITCSRVYLFLLHSV